MAYNKSRYDEVQQMGAGDLVHFMVSRYAPANDDRERPAYMQSAEYLWALERLNTMLPAAPVAGQTDV